MTRNEKFNRSVRSLDTMIEGIDIDKAAFLSDCGKGVNRMIDDIERRERSETGQTGRTGRTGRKESKLFDAEMRLAEAGKSYLILVLLLIVENGSEREVSMTKVPRRTYFRHRDELLRFFTSWHSGVHGYIEGYA